VHLPHQRVGFVHRLFDLALLQRGVLWSETDHHALACISDRTAGMQEFGAGDHLEFSKVHHVAALALMMNTGLDPSDALRLRKDQIDDGTIWGVRGKTGEEVAIPVSPTLQEALDRITDHEAETVLSNSRGEAWTYNGFSTVWHRFKSTLEKEGFIEKGLTLKGLRHTVATTLREAGLDERRIADLLGQKTPSMARHYSRSANLADKNRETIATLEKEIERRTKIVKPSEKRVKPD